MTTYSLSDYILSVVVPESLYDVYGSDNKISIGGDKSYNGVININLPTATWTTKGDATGSFYHEKNKSRVGTVTVSIAQVSDNVLRLIRLFNAYFSTDSSVQGLTMTLNRAVGNNQETIENMNSCMLNLPDIAYREEVSNQDWVFTCGEIIFNSSVQ